VTDTTALDGLRQISLADLPAYKQAINQTQRKGWVHYFAYLLLISQGGVRKTGGETFWLGDDAGSLCVYHLRPGSSGPRLRLFLAPMPLQVAVVLRCLQRVRQYNGGGSVGVFRMDADESAALRGLPGARMAACAEEYLYQPARYQKLAGGEFADLRKAVNQMGRAGDVQVTRYRRADASACRDVHRQWVAAQGSKYPAINNLTFTRNCLEMADDFPPEDLFGVVVRVNGEVRSFGFAGEIRANMGNLFISYSDHRVSGLHKFMTLQLFAGLQHLALVNSGDAEGAPSLAAAKRAMASVGTHAMCQVYLD